jgi:hypothetical protein
MIGNNGEEPYTWPVSEETASERPSIIIISDFV